MFKFVKNGLSISGDSVTALKSCLTTLIKSVFSIQSSMSFEPFDLLFITVLI